MKRPPYFRKRLFSLGILIVLGTIACIVLLFIPPGSANARWLPKCALHELTGLHCPGCGATRALSAILRGDWKASLHNNLLLFPAIATAAVLILKPELAQRRPVGIIVLVLVLGFTVLRNIPCEPFTLLAPIPVP